MGIMGESIAAYAKPLIDQTDGSKEQVDLAFGVATICWNLALLPEEAQEDGLIGIQKSLEMDDEEFKGFRRSVIDPMIQRRHEMFPNMAQTASVSPATEAFDDALLEAFTSPSVPYRNREKKLGRNDPCHCGSGKKYKKCCLEADQNAGSQQQIGDGINDDDLPSFEFSEIDDLSNATAVLIEAGHFDDAELACQDLIERFPDQMDGIWRRAMLREAQGRFADAAQCYRETADFMRSSDGVDQEGIDEMLENVSQMEAKAAAQR